MTEGGRGGESDRGSVEDQGLGGLGIAENEGRLYRGYPVARAKVGNRCATGDEKVD